jgi:hypothetical protein
MVYLKTLDIFFGNCIMKRGNKQEKYYTNETFEKLPQESRNTLIMLPREEYILELQNYLCLSLYKGKFAVDPPNNHNIKELSRGYFNHCKEMLGPLEKYSNAEINSYKDIENIPEYSTGADIFRQSRPSKTNFSSIDVYRAGTSGNTLNLILLFLLLATDDYVQNKKLFICVILGLLINMTQYYHHSLREILIVYIALFYENNDIIITELWNNVIALYKEPGSEETNFEIVSQKIYNLINTIINLDTTDAKLTSKYLRLLIDNRMMKFKTARGIIIIDSFIKVRQQILASNTVDINEDNEGNVAVCDVTGKVINKVTCGTYEVILKKLNEL